MASKWDFVTPRAVTEERKANKNSGPSGVTHRGTSAWAGQPNSTCSGDAEQWLGSARRSVCRKPAGVWRGREGRAGSLGTAYEP